MCRRLCLAAVLFAFLAIAPAHAADYTNPKGFSLSYPSYWNAATGDELDSILRMIKAPKNRLESIEAMFFDPANPNRNVVAVVSRYEDLPASDPESFRKYLSPKIERNGMRISNVQSQTVQMNGRTALLASWDLEGSGASVGKQSQIMLMVPGDVRTVTIMCTSAAREAGMMQSIFGRTLSSVKVADEPALTLQERWNYRTRAQVSLASLCIAGFIVLLWKVFRTRKPEPEI